MIIFRDFDKISSNIFHIICQNLIRQFLKVTFNEIFCKLALFLFYGTPAYYIASGNSCWLLWPKCWLETEFDYRLRLRFSLLIQLILGKCVGTALHPPPNHEDRSDDYHDRFQHLGCSIVTAAQEARRDPRLALDFLRRRSLFPASHSL